MAAIPVATRLRAHQKVKRLAEVLEVEMSTAVGVLVLLWSWALENAADDGTIGDDARTVAAACAWRGDPFRLYTALQDPSCLWLEPEGERLKVRNWDTHERPVREWARRRLRGEQHERALDIADGKVYRPVPYRGSAPQREVYSRAFLRARNGYPSYKRGPIADGWQAWNETLERWDGTDDELADRCERVALANLRQLKAWREEQGKWIPMFPKFLNSDGWAEEV